MLRTGCWLVVGSVVLLCVFVALQVLADQRHAARGWPGPMVPGPGTAGWCVLGLAVLSNVAGVVLVVVNTAGLFSV